MIYTIQSRIKKYREDISKWIAHDGMSGGGGEWNRKEHKYDFASKPAPEQCAGDSQFEIKLFSQIEASELELHARRTGK